MHCYLLKECCYLLTVGSNLNGQTTCISVLLTAVVFPSAKEIPTLKGRADRERAFRTGISGKAEGSSLGSGARLTIQKVVDRNGSM